MKYSLAVLAASAAFVSAQITFNETTNTYDCAGNINGDYCAGTSLVTNIIVRCKNGIGAIGNCNDNLAGEPPKGDNFSPCYETNTTAGDAVCSKNCIGYNEPNFATNFTVPGCTPVSTPPESSFGSTIPLETPTSTPASNSSVTSISTSATTTSAAGTTTSAPPSPPSNGTTTTASSGSTTASTTGGSTSTSTGPSQVTGNGAIAHTAVPGLAAAALALAYFL